MNSNLPEGLNGFLGRASKATYAGGGDEIEPWRPGFKELEHRENDWYYRDSYSGFLRSWGQEVVWHNDKPVWTCLYGGGMTENRMDSEFAGKTFHFLKKVLSAGDKENVFQPRGPKELSEDSWQYLCQLEGNIKKFNGHESISYNGEVVFTHDFLGGVIASN